MRMRKMVTIILSMFLVVVVGCGRTNTKNAGTVTSGSRSQAVGAEAVQEIKVGVILPLTGSLATTGEMIKKSVDFAVKRVNDAGGIKSMGGAKLKPVFADSQGKPEIGAGEAERLVLNEKVAALMGAYQSSVTLPATVVAERYKVPWVVISSVANEITERGFKYVFRPTNRAADDARSMVNFLADLPKLTGGLGVKTVALASENTDWGQGMAKIIAAEAPKAGLDLVLNEFYPSNSPDLSSLVAKIKQANPDAVLLNSYVSDAIQITKLMDQLGVRPKLVLGGSGGFIDPAYLKAVGALAENFFTLQNWSPSLIPLMPSWAAEMNAAYKATYGEDISGDAACAIVSVLVLADALERAGTTDGPKLRDALAATNITEGPAMLLLPKRIAFDTNGQNVDVVTPVAQIRNGEYVMVWPKQFTTEGTKVVFPLPQK